MTITLAVLLGFALDWLLGDPKKLPHPVCAVGKLISGTEKVLRRIFPTTPASLTFAGIVLWLITCGVSFAVPFFLLRWLYHVNFWLGFAAETLLCWMIFARKSLANAGYYVYGAVEQSLEEGRKAIAWYVGRDTAELTEEGVIKAAVETDGREPDRRCGLAARVHAHRRSAARHAVQGGQHAGFHGRLS